MRLLLYLSGEVIYNIFAHKKRVILLAMNVTKERIKGNMAFVLLPSRACSNVPGMLITLDVANTMSMIMMLPINHAMREPRDVMATSCIFTAFGQKDMVLVFNSFK